MCITDITPKADVLDKKQKKQWITIAFSITFLYFAVQGEEKGHRICKLNRRVT